MSTALNPYVSPYPRRPYRPNGIIERCSSTNWYISPVPRRRYLPPIKKCYARHPKTRYTYCRLPNTCYVITPLGSRIGIRVLSIQTSGTTTHPPRQTTGRGINPVCFSSENTIVLKRTTGRVYVK